MYIFYGSLLGSFPLVFLTHHFLHSHFLDENLKDTSVLGLSVMSSSSLQVSSIIYTNSLLGISNPVRQRRSIIYIPLTKKKCSKLKLLQKRQNFCIKVHKCSRFYRGWKQLLFLFASIKPISNTYRASTRKNCFFNELRWSQNQNSSSSLGSTE